MSLGDLKELTEQSQIEQHATAYRHVASIGLLVNQEFEKADLLELALETSMLIESQLLGHLRNAGIDVSRYRISLLPNFAKSGSLLLSLGVFLGSVLLPAWLFLRDYEKVRSGIISFTKDLEAILERSSTAGNRVNPQRIEPLLVATATLKQAELDDGDRLIAAWQNDDRNVREELRTITANMQRQIDFTKKR